VLFNSLQFFAFFAVVLVLYYNVGHRWQNRLLLGASYVFYGWWDWRFTLLMLGSTVIDFVCAIRIDKSDAATVRKRWVAASVVSHLLILGFFKYFDFFVGTAEVLAGNVGLPVRLMHLHLVLPVGLSFYTFKSMSYTIDVFLDFALFVSFFPQLVAGPIERASHLLPQVIEPRRPLTPDDIRTAVYLIGWGLFKKVIVGDGCAHLANTVFNNHGAFSGLDHLIALYAFAFQIYADFSGYSDMAIGIARLLGFDLVTNFRLPYFATSPSDLWHRWHISLSTWLRDYLYIPLGGSRDGELKTYRNLIITMALGGLWHGARWTMVLWGLYHGIGLAVHRFATRGSRPADGPPDRAWVPLKILLTFHFTCFGWLLFRADSLGQVGEMLTAMITDVRATAWTWPAVGTLVQLTVLLSAYQVAQYVRDDLLLALHWRPLRRLAFGLAVVYSAALFWMMHRSLVAAAQPFIYFQF
jgi:alginate O-acetyltransferase complex protein AlgI